MAVTVVVKYMVEALLAAQSVKVFERRALTHVKQQGEVHVYPSAARTMLMRKEQHL